jgi:hypothetical protein
MVASELFNTYRSYAQNTHTIEIIINNVEYKILVIASRKYNYTSNTKLGLCCHQCTKCGVIFGCKSTFVQIVAVVHSIMVNIAHALVQR